MRRVSLGVWLMVLGLYLATHLVGVLKWRLMINLAGAGVSYAQAVRCYFAGLFGTLFLPSIIGGDILRIGLALRLARNRAGAVLGSLLDRVVDFAALASVAGFGAFLLPGALDPRSRKIFWMLAAGIAALIAILAAVVALVPARRFSHRMRRRLVRLRQAVLAMSRRPQYVLAALALGIAVQTTLALLTSRIAAACGLRLPLRAWLFAWPLAKLSSLLPVTQGGIGVRELALIALVAPLGAPPLLAFAVGLVWESIIYSGWLLAGLVVLVLGRLAGPAASTLRVSATVSSAKNRSEDPGS
jgi:uncharacterized protein (TIRG00374 family)